ncbi:mitochondrial carrier domain-containing protein [Aspergillus sergii]|uniref:Mitochondrial carrier domain-containing protein n=1 Tax=Aspergillus sergii TaxID=1034303 RepID=A0A5N6XI70_9EURO|nr:mitochondrial carrier domain-containing protein [Aspergillus sergii]
MTSELKANEPNVAGWRETVTDLTVGVAGGAAQVLIDLVKGTLMPLLGVGTCVSIQFDKRPGHDPILSIPQYYLAGAGAGVATSMISGPVEHIRIRLQTQPHGAARIYNGPLDCAVQLIRTAGIAAYEGLVGIAMDRQQKKREELPSWQIALCGGLAGEALWLLSHPLDVIKSKMKSDGFRAEKKYRNMRDAFRHTWITGGLRGLFYGLGPALLWAMPVSAGTFATVEVVRKFLG